MKKYFEKDSFFLVILTLLACVLSALNYTVAFHYDDFDQILRNENLHDLFDLKAIINDPIRPQRFIQNLTFAFNWFISQSEPWSYHLFNNALHLGNTILLFYLLPLLGVKNRKVQLATCFLFFVHPLQVEPVSYIMGRIELLKTASTLGLLILYLRRANKWIIYSLLIMSLLIKETCVLTIFLFLALDLTVLQKNLKEINFKEHALYVSHLIFLIPIYRFLDTTYQYGHVVGFDLYPFIQYALSNIHFLIYYFYLYFNPSEQSIYHDWTGSPPVLNVVLGTIVYLGMAWYMVTQYRKKPVNVFMLFLFLISFLPNNSILQFINPFAEYRLYQSTLVLAYFCSLAVFSGNLFTGVKQACAALFVIFLMTFHYLHIETWKSPITLWGYAYQTYPTSLHTNFGIGTTHIYSGLCDSGIKHIEYACQKSQEIRFWEIKCNAVLSQFYGGTKQFEKALPFLERLKKSTIFEPDWVYYHNYLLTLEALKKEKEYNDLLLEVKKKFPNRFKDYRFDPFFDPSTLTSRFNCIEESVPTRR